MFPCHEHNSHRGPVSAYWMDSQSEGQFYQPSACHLWPTCQGRLVILGIKAKACLGLTGHGLSFLLCLPASPSLLALSLWK